jgi:hypothetical protein
LDAPFQYERVSQQEDGSLQAYGDFSLVQDRKYGTHALQLFSESQAYMEKPILLPEATFSFTWSFWMKIQDWHADDAMAEKMYAYTLVNDDVEYLYAAKNSFSDSLDGGFWGEDEVNLWTAEESSTYFNQWVHVAYTQSIDRIQFYRNGQLIYTKLYSYPKYVGSGSLMLFSSHPYASSYSMTVAFDDVRFYVTFLNDAQIQAVMCYNGFYWNSVSATSGFCAECGSGTYSGLQGNTQACTDCEVGTYQNKTAQSFCTSCAMYQTTSSTGSTSSKDCVSSAGMINCYDNL